jgi:hypothetical protein
MQVYDYRFPAESRWNGRRTNYPNIFCYKTLYVSGIFCAHHQEFYTVHPALVSFMQVSDDRFQAESGWNWIEVIEFLPNSEHEPSGL